ncbi:MAG: hypothetical protein IJS65_06060 [Clostridia bacterium]|nr:hypothetical protein [Clostridia bacterium]
MENVLKIAALSLTAVIVSLLIKDKNPVGAFSVTFITLLLIGSFLIPRLKDVFDAYIGAFSGVFEDKALIGPLIKTVIIALICRLTSEICSEKGEKALGFQVELAGVTAGLVCAFPLVKTVLRIIGEV